MKIICLTHSPLENAKLAEAAKQRGHEIRFVNPAKTLQYISENEKGLDRFYLVTDEVKPERIFSRDVDVVIPRIGSGVEYGSSILRFMVENLNCYSPNNPWGHVFASNKAYTLQKLSSVGIKVPRTIITESPQHVAWIVDQIKLPIIVKTWNGSKGRTVGICDSKRSANSLFAFAIHAGLKILLEQYIETGGTDYRVWVVGNKVSVAMKRTSGDTKDFRANISQGGKGEKVELSKEDQDLCIKAAHSIGLNVAGVDLMKAEDGTSYIIEINSNPGVKVIDITGVNPFIDIIQFCEDNYKKSESGVQARNSITKTEMLLDENFFENLEEAIRQKANLSFPLGGLLLGGLLR
jgi:ribosomal protein S6--L-glutamate ligase